MDLPLELQYYLWSIWIWLLYGVRILGTLKKGFYLHYGILFSIIERILIIPKGQSMVECKQRSV